ncbi:MAG: dihydroorotate dehydrogenase electron transfer subunit [Clostridiales bacterium]|nr:dihydroorotate dehydrogenase electron transfer subunit [Clostridiales bacterium]
MKKAYKCKLILKTELCPGIWDFVVEAPEIAKQAQVGQFLHIACGGSTLLRRPISICDTGENFVRFCFQVKGEGTKLLAMTEVGEDIDIMGPLGHGFTVTPGEKSVIIGGGIGVFPLLKLAREKDSVVFLGFRNKDLVVMEDDYLEANKNLTICTDDGSYGYNGFAVAAMGEYLLENKVDMIYCCGPTPMLKTVKQIAEHKNIPCQLSLEQRMGCGIGACLTCVCETKNEGMAKYKQVCTCGPVFDSKEVVL